MELTIILPTLNEADNVGPMTQALRSSLAAALVEHPGLVAEDGWELLVVDDDSHDGTAEVVRALCMSQVRVLQREGKRGQASACYDGMRASAATYVAVMDCDFQHEPAAVWRMLGAIKAAGVELAIGTRPLGYRGLASQFPWHRRVGSKSFLWLTQRVVPPGYQDPLSGFFLCSRDLFLALEPRLSSNGFKPLTDMLTAAGGFIPHVSVAYAFGTRRSGTSKLAGRQVLQLLWLLVIRALRRRREGAASHYPSHYQPLARHPTDHEHAVEGRHAGQEEAAERRVPGA